MSELSANAERMSQKDLTVMHSISVRKIKAIANDEYSEWAILDSLLESVNRFQIKQGVYRQLSDSEFEILVASYLVIMEQTLFSETN